MEDRFIAHLRQLVDEAVTLRDATQRLITEITEHLHDNVSVAADAPKRDRQRKPRQTKL
jgi:hypothetical protein